MKEHVIDVIVIILLIIHIILQLITIYKYDKLKIKVEQLERNNTQVHEYILNRIGG